MHRFVALCFAGFSIDPAVPLKENRRVEEEIISIRNSVYFYFGLDLPLADELDFPRYHFDGNIVHPMTGGIDSPPFAFSNKNFHRVTS